MSEGADRFRRACEAFEGAHREDPRAVVEEGQRIPAAVAYHRRVAAWVEALAPDASEALRLAARCQHLRRWEIPREQFPAGPTGYKQWRAHLAQRHASQASAILTGVGYDEATVGRVRGLLIKKGLPSAGPEDDVQILEDAVCLTFLEQQLEEFAAAHDAPKTVEVLRKTWAKMGPTGRAAAAGLVPFLPPAVRALVEQVAGGPP